MSESPDFEQIAQRVAVMSCEACAAMMRLAEDGIHYDDARGGATWGMCRTVVAEIQIAEQLRLVWNARGAADIAKLEFEIQKVWTSAEPAGPLTRALRSLDR